MGADGSGPPGGRETPRSRGVYLLPNAFTVANLFAGIILLLDKSIKPGDIIEVGGTYGWVSALGATSSGNSARACR